MEILQRRERTILAQRAGPKFNSLWLLLSVCA